MHNEIIIYKNGELELPVEVTPDKETVWLNRNQLATLFDRDVKTIGKHINNALKEELDFSVVAKFATTASDGKTYKVDYYNLDMIISVGYRVKSARGVEFRRWANKILKDYIVQGYAVNERRLAALNRVVEIQSNIIEGVIEEKAANLLYFIIKDHPFVDGCKRIAATTFLYFLDMKRILYKNNKKILSDSTLVSLTLLITESKPQEKEIMINIVMNFLTWYIISP